MTSKTWTASKRAIAPHNSHILAFINEATAELSDSVSESTLKALRARVLRKLSSYEKSYGDFVSCEGVPEAQEDAFQTDLTVYRETLGSLECLVANIESQLEERDLVAKAEVEHEF